VSEEILEEELANEEIGEKESKKKKKKDVILELEEKCATLNEKYLYALAQMRDLHKTYEKENAIAIKYVTYDLMEELLPILDIFSMVLENENIPSEVQAYFKGFELVFNQFKQILDRHGVSEIKCSIGDKFDHNVHNGVEKVEIEEGEHDTIAQVLQKGYKIGDKVLRPVSVKVYCLKDNKETTIEQEATINESEDKGE
jgi:molecular chaperone GrpE